MDTFLDAFKIPFMLQQAESCTSVSGAGRRAWTNALENEGRGIAPLIIPKHSRLQAGICSLRCRLQSKAKIVFPKALRQCGPVPAGSYASS